MLLASLVSDALLGLGCVTFSFALMAFGAFLLALRCGLLSGLVAKLKQLATEPPPKSNEGGATP
jgi:hypothetical protein